MKYKFKQGDRVRKTSKGTKYGVAQGDCGTVTEDDHNPYVQWEWCTHGDGKWAFMDSELELIEQNTMKEIIVKIGKSPKLAQIAIDHAESLGYEPDFPWDASRIEIALTLNRSLSIKCYDFGVTSLYLHSTNKITHSLEEFFELTKEDVQEYQPKTHTVNASRIKELLEVDLRDIIQLED